MKFAGADGGPSDFRKAAKWAHRSLGYLKRANDPELKRSIGLAALRLDYYAAEGVAELRRIHRELNKFFVENCGSRKVDTTCAQNLKLLGELERDLSALGDSKARQRSIAAFRRYLETEAGKSRGPERASALLDKGTLLSQTPEGSLSPKEADEAETALREAAVTFQNERDGRARLAELNLAAFLSMHRAAQGASLDEAESALREILADGSISQEIKYNSQRNLGSVLFKKQTGDHQQNLREAIELLRSAHAATPQRDIRTWAKTGLNLALVLEASGVRARQNLAEAEALLEELLGATVRHRMKLESAEIAATLASVRLHRLSIGDGDDLASVKKILSRAGALADGASPLERARLAALTADYHSAEAASGKPESVDAAIRELRKAIALTDRRLAPALWATFENNLGNRCNNRTRPDLADCAAEAYGKALTVRTAAAMPREHTDTIVNLANLRFNQGDWASAADLYTQAANASRAAFDPALDRDVLLFDAARSDRWFERAAYALARTGKTSAGIAIADEGRLRVLRQHLSGLPKSAAPGTISDRLNDLLTEDAIVLMPIVTMAGSVLFTIGLKNRDVKAEHFLLDQLSGDRVARFLEDRWLRTYREVFQTQAVDGADERWNSAIMEMGDWLEALLSPALPRLENDGLWPRKKVIFVVQGELALVPLHMAKLPNGKRLIEVADVSYLPNLALWEPVAAPTDRSKLFSISASQDSNLPYAAAEAGIAPLLGGTKLDGAIDRTQFLNALAEADIFHFVGHAQFEVDNPQGSSLRLNGQERVEVRDIEAARLPKGPRVVILSACETGRIETATMANEFVGLPTAFMSKSAIAGRLFLPCSRRL